MNKIDFASLDPYPINASLTRPSTSKKAAKGDPLGFTPHLYTSIRSTTKRTRADSVGDDPQSTLKLKKAWDVALSPAKSIPMNAFMLWMAGSGIQIFSIMITVMLLFQPIRAMMNTQTTFTPFKAIVGRSGVDLTLPKIVFLLMNMASMMMGMYKLTSMGLLPTSSSDWLAFLPHKQMAEYSL
jgi:hypothetical protein